MPTTVLLTRHGKTAANLENRFAGRTGELLHPQGRAQIAEVAGTLKRKRISAIYAGPLARTGQSAEIIAGLTGAKVHEKEAFNEILIPHWDGLSKEEITARFGAEYPTWLSAPDRFRLPGCETLAQVRERAVAGIEELFSAHPGEAVVVVSHLIVVRCLILHYRKQPLGAFRSIKVDNGAITGLVRDDRGTTEVIPTD
ncbi:MAG: histidine phosphatase family protein [Desulfurivibrionaceae bacterium]|nr:histidine phosphatase family protein [Desulfobulbales bacterium]MDT8334221.1 histidine phosphatase family protein [Desulfurivibrionaceae bacterium]